MLALRVVQARYGDCLILENGSGKWRKHILIDGGPSGVYQPYLSKELQRIAGEGGQIDLMVLTHVDNDHVLGLLELMQELKSQRQSGRPEMIHVQEVWHNAFRRLLPEAGSEADRLESTILAQEGKNPLAGEEWAMENPATAEAMEFGIGEGVLLQMANELLQIPRNTRFPQELATLENARRPERIASLRLWLLGPSSANLEELRKKWMHWLDAQAGRVAFDFATPLVEPDDSVNNLSSIMLLAEASGRSILLAGDGRSKDILQGLECIGKLPPGGILSVDVMKVPHHGSARNADAELFDRVLAARYVFSADGKNGNPDWQTLLWLLDAANRQQRKIHIFATNWAESLMQLLKERPPESNSYCLAVMPEGCTSFVV
jgi:hypothetical protein